MGTVEVELDAIRDMADKILRLIVKSAELEDDLAKEKARLDWLETADKGFYFCGVLGHMQTTGHIEWGEDDEMTLRQAIDAAMEAE